MKKKKLSKDPYNAIITGVGGQGNVMASRLLGNILVKKGYYVTIGETFGASQRGGSVMSHLRISEKSNWSPIIPSGKADLVVSLEPIESIRVMAKYGNSNVKIISNTRPIHPVQVIAGEQEYPSLDDVKTTVDELTSDYTFIDATEEALKLGNPILGNIIMIGAVSGKGILPFDKKDFKEVISDFIPPDKVEMNIKAFEIGEKMVQ
jgi:indolepyruvate ferredoxin oxidoreductase beta subunit